MSCSLKEQGGETESPDFVPGTETPSHSTDGTLLADSSGRPPVPTGARADTAGQAIERVPGRPVLPRGRRWERRTDPCRPDHIEPSTWAPMLQSIKDSEYQKWLLADPAAAQRAW